MRCCIATLVEYEGPEEEGTIVSCAHCGEPMIVENGVWKWNRD